MRFDGQSDRRGSDQDRADAKQHRQHHPQPRNHPGEVGNSLHPGLLHDHLGRPGMTAGKRRQGLQISRVRPGNQRGAQGCRQWIDLEQVQRIGNVGISLELGQRLLWGDDRHLLHRRLPTEGRGQLVDDGRSDTEVEVHRQPGTTFPGPGHGGEVELQQE